MLSQYLGKIQCQVVVFSYTLGPSTHGLVTDIGNTVSRLRFQN